ncbi:MAG: hypothetical protein M3094_01395 [Actinomycetia bacterium]|nr:hypothetical protein [Actinomycetes bacterium]
MIIDCDRCVMVNTDACDGCVVSALVGSTGVLALAEEEAQAIEAMSRVGLVPPLRLVEGGERAADSRS